MSSKAQDPKEFRKYRQLLVAVYIGLGALGTLWVTVSVIVDLFMKETPAAPAPTGADLRKCNDDVRDLLDGLSAQAATLVAGASSAAEGELGGRWEVFSKSWQREWDAVGRRCQFDELAETGLGPAYDRMAWVYRNLPTMELKYRELMKRFTDEQADELAAMKKALEKSRGLLQDAAEKKGKPDNE